VKKLLKWTGIIFGGLICLSALIAMVLYLIGMKKLAQSYPDNPVETIEIPIDVDAVANGRHIATIWACTGCHRKDLSGALITKDPLSGMFPVLGTIIAPNLTSGEGGIATSYSDMDWIRAIRFGVTREGHSEIFMFDYSTLSDQDLGDLIAYIKQVPPVDTDYPGMNYGPLVPIVSNFELLMPAGIRTDHRVSRPLKVSPGATVEYGGYLAAICTACHGNAVSSMVKKWTQDEFVSALNSGVMPTGKRFGSMMSSDAIREMTDMELTALWLSFTNGKP